MLIILIARCEDHSQDPRAGLLYLLTLSQQKLSTAWTGTPSYDWPLKLMTVEASPIPRALTCYGSARAVIYHNQNEREQSRMAFRAVMLDFLSRHVSLDLSEGMQYFGGVTLLCSILSNKPVIVTQSIYTYDQYEPQRLFDQYSQLDTHEPINKHR